jgi:hypothetical protein
MKRMGMVISFCLLAAFATFASMSMKAGRTSMPADPAAAGSVQSRPSDGGRVEAHRDGAEDGVSLSCTLARTNVVLREPVVLNFVVENTLSQPVKLDLGYDRKGSFLFTVAQPDGKKVELRQSLKMGLSRIGEVRLEAGRTYRQNLLLNEWYEFPAAGDYEVQVRLAKPIQTQDGQDISVPTEFRLPLKVGAENPAQLSEVCSELAARVAAADSYDEAAEAALALSYIKDAVAVPYLQEVLASGHLVEPIAVAGLEHNGSNESVEALLSALRTQPRQVKEELILPALMRVKVAVSDPELKKRVERALQNHS